MGQPLLTPLTQIVAKPTSVEGCIRVSLLSPGKTARFECAGYYFGCNKQAREWDMERRLYEGAVFRWVMLFALAGSFAGLTELALVV